MNVFRKLGKREARLHSVTAASTNGFGNQWQVHFVFRQRWCQIIQIIQAEEPWHCEAFAFSQPGVYQVLVIVYFEKTRWLPDNMNLHRCDLGGSLQRVIREQDGICPEMSCAMFDGIQESSLCVGEAPI